VSLKGEPDYRRLWRESDQLLQTAAVQIGELTTRVAHLEAELEQYRDAYERGLLGPAIQRSDVALLAEAEWAAVLRRARWTRNKARRTTSPRARPSGSRKANRSAGSAA
jgi:hypothetical protein